MPSRSVLLGSMLAALALALPAAAPAKVVVVDRAGHVVATPVRSATGGGLLGWTADGAALLTQERDRVVRIDPRTGARVALGTRRGLAAIGPGGDWIASVLRVGPEGASLAATLHAPDGRTVATTHLAVSSYEGQNLTASWAGGRVAVSTDAEAIVWDLATGAELRRTAVAAVVGGILSPDGAALLAARGDTLARVDVTTGAEQVLATGEDRHTPPIGRFAKTGRLAISKGDRIWLDGAAAPIQLPTASTANWLAPDGTGVAATIRRSVASPCDADRESLLAYAPGARPVTLVPAFAGEVVAASWSPDGALVAVDERLADPDFYAERRGARHPWPKRPIGKDYEMLSARGDRAVRRVVVRFAADLRRGLSRRHALERLGAALNRISEQPWGGDVLDTAVEEAIAGELDPWLHAAGFRTIDATSELEGDGC